MDLIGALIEVVFVALLLSGEQAVALALATRALSPRDKKLAVNIGTLGFIGLRVALALALLALTAAPGLGLFCALVLIGAVAALSFRDETGPDLPLSRGLGAALRSAVGYDAPLALFAMVAIFSAAQGERVLTLLGLALSIPLIALGSAQFLTALRRPPLLFFGAGLLGWIAGQAAALDLLLHPLDIEAAKLAGGGLGAFVALGLSLLGRRGWIKGRFK